MSKHPKQSRTLRFNRVVMMAAGAFAFLPDVIAFLLDLVADPSIGAAVSDLFPLKYRALLSLVVAAVAAKNRQYRYQTNEAITKEW